MMVPLSCQVAHSTNCAILKIPVNDSFTVLLSAPSSRMYNTAVDCMAERGDGQCLPFLVHCGARQIDVMNGI